MPLPISTICVAAAFLFGIGYHEEIVGGIYIVLALINEIMRIYSLRGMPVEQTKAGDTTLIPSRERTPYEGRDEH